MNLTDEQLEKVQKWGRFNIPAEKMAIMLGLCVEEKQMFIFLFNDPESLIRLEWDNGRVFSEIEVMESLESFSKSNQEGSGEAAKALGAIKKRQTLNNLKHELFGI